MSDLGSGHDLAIPEFEPLRWVLLTAESLEPALDSVSTSFSPHRLLVLSLSLKNKH